MQLDTIASFVAEYISNKQPDEHYHGREDIIHQSKLVDMLTGRKPKDDDDPVLVRGNAFDLACKLEDYRMFTKTYKASVESAPSAAMEKGFAEYLIEKRFKVDEPYGEQKARDWMDAKDADGKFLFWRSSTSENARVKKFNEVWPKIKDYVREQVSLFDVDSKYILSADDLNGVMVAAERAHKLTTEKIQAIKNMYHECVILSMVDVKWFWNFESTDANVEFAGELDRLWIIVHREPEDGVIHVRLLSTDYKYSMYPDWSKAFLSSYNYVQYITYIDMMEKMLREIQMHYIDQYGNTEEISFNVLEADMDYLVGNPNKSETVIPIEVDPQFRLMHHSSMETASGYIYPSVISIVDEYLFRKEKDDWSSPMEYLQNGYIKIEINKTYKMI